MYRGKVRDSVLVLLLAAIVAFIVLGVYFFNFSGVFGDQESFGQFGDYVGGVLNPIFAFLTICLLLLSIHVQLQELKETREEIRRSAEAFEQQNSIMQRQMEAALLVDLLGKEIASFHSVIRDSQPITFARKNPKDKFSISLADLWSRSISDVQMEAYVGLAAEISTSRTGSNFYVHPKVEDRIQELVRSAERVMFIARNLMPYLSSLGLFSSSMSKPEEIGQFYDAFLQRMKNVPNQSNYADFLNDFNRCRNKLLEGLGIDRRA